MNNIRAIIADDHTGAADSGIHFAKAGRRTSLLLDHSEINDRLPRLNAIALSTESRFMTPKAAAAQVRDTIEQCKGAGVNRFFKKVDSTMRGNPGSEIAAALEATGCRSALVCTAMPETGRTCVDGVILLDGVPLHTTHFGRDPFHPLSTSTISQLLDSQCNLPTERLSLDDLRGPADRLAAQVRRLMDQGCRLLIADAVGTTDMRILGGLLHNMPEILPVGAAGLARALAWAGRNGKEDTEPVQTMNSGPRKGNILAIIGSLAGVSRNQADIACAEGRFRVLDLDPDAASTCLKSECTRLVRTAKKNVHSNLLLKSKELLGQQKKTGIDGERVAGILGHAAKTIFQSTPYDIIFSTGGNTSMAVAKAMDIKSVSLIEELMPGVVLGSCEVPHFGQRWFITKAGGFGGSSLLVDIADRFACTCE